MCKSYIEPYPLADRKTGKKDRLRLRRLVETLLEKVQHEILYDQVVTRSCWNPLPSAILLFLS